MEVKALTHEVRIQQWSQIVKTCRSSGKTIKGWCSENNINLKTYYHWQKRVCEKTCAELAVRTEQAPENAVVGSGPRFAELSIAKPNAGKVALTICHPAMQIHIYGGADTIMVETVLRALSRQC